MLDLIFAIKFVHVLAAAVMLGTWLGIAVFMELANRSGNTSVVALIANFAVSTEKLVMIAAIALQPISGFMLSSAIGLSVLEEAWLTISLVLYGLVVVAWLAALRVEIRIRELARQAALDGVPLRGRYRRLYRLYRIVVWPALAAMVVLFLLMVWQPRGS
jgi:uncharacterized membrane protein